MSIYQCPRCYKNFDRYYHFKRHVNKKIPCSKIVNRNNNTKNEFVCKHCFKLFTRSDNLRRHVEKSTCHLTQHTYLPKNDSEECTKSNECNKCQYCNKILSTKGNLKRHTDNYCKTKNILLLQNTQNTQNNQLHNQSHNTTTNNTNQINSHNPTTTTNSNNVIQNITINSYGKENLDYIDDDFFKYLLKIPYGGIPKLIRMIHYHPDHPENHNVLLNVSGKRLNLAKTWDGDEWFIKNKSAVVWDLMTSSYDKIDEKYDQYRSELNQFKRTNYTNFRKEFENPSKKFLREMKSDIELVLLNYSKKIIEELKKRKLSDKLNPTKATTQPIELCQNPVIPVVTQQNPIPVNSLEIKMPDDNAPLDLSKIPLPFRHYKPLE